MTTYFGYISLMGIILTLVSIGISWWALQSIRFDLFIYNPKSPQTKALQIILSIVIGYQMAQFFINYLQWSFNVKSMF
ncbi:DUF1146 family protein [Tepidibacillus infernus]|uniref:DUF1146 family protein n=1 Tax=Tepidibacillus infernus TaxID=1806172 RepID=UPI003B758A97